MLEPINNLEKTQDTQAIWRTKVNHCLENEYTELFDTIDYLLMLKAPSFKQVYQWRLLQENKLAQSVCKRNNQSHTVPNKLFSKSQLKYFIQHYQRITEHCLLTIPNKADAIIQLDEAHHMTQLIYSK